ncbi:MAG: hypothetical protein J6K21_00045 [Bacilli bacterium]|nr:hypothetical protein [Bacilli bacterium]
MKTKRTPKAVIVLLVIIGSLITISPFVLFMFLIINDTSSQFKIENDGSININDGKITVLSDTTGRYDEKDDCYYIEGIIKNNTKRDYSVSLTYNLYDKDKIILGTTDVYLDNLDSKGKWKFKASYCDYAEEVDSFKVVSAESYEY